MPNIGLQAMLNRKYSQKLYYILLKLLQMIISTKIFKKKTGASKPANQPASDIGSVVVSEGKLVLSLVSPFHQTLGYTLSGDW